MEENVAPVAPEKARKRKRDPSTWKRALQKVARYSSKSVPSLIECNHGPSDKHFKCKKLTLLDIKAFHDEFYKTKNKKDQDAFLLKHCSVRKTKRRRPRVGIRKATAHTTRLFVRKRGSTKLLRVCQKSFLNILNITVHRVRRVAKIFTETGGIVQEKRGGDHTSGKNNAKRRAVMNFIQKFKCIESHYCRSSTGFERKYLSSELNMRKMYRMYCEQCEDHSLKVRECFFRMIFRKRYNLGFGNPRTDTCSKCNELQERIKKSGDPAEKQKLITEKRVHTLKARAFYRLLKEKRDDLMVFSFDCQKNQTLPKVSDGVAYYSRQLYIYNFAIVRSMPDNTLNKNNVTLYTWTEDEHKKGSNEIASAVFDCLLNTTFDENITTVRLVADGCGAQNKNTTMIGMCTVWLNRVAPPHIQSVEVIFPIPGHSFLPPDRVFGQIEKEIKKKEVIVNPEEYIEIFQRYGMVKHFDDVHDWKSELDKVLKPPGKWHFQFQPTKRFYLKRNEKFVLRGEPNYTADIGISKSVTKKRNSLIDVNPKRIEKHKVVLNASKIEDVKNLLNKHFGPDWAIREDLKYYKQVLNSSQDGADETPVEICEAAVPNSDLRV